MTRRVFIVAFLLVLGAGALNWLSRAEAHVPRLTLAKFPMTLGAWQGRENPPFEAKVIRVLGVDDHLNRTYIAGSLPVSLYIGYYDSQRTGETIHSPMKCLPGTGWQPLSTGQTAIPVRTADGASQDVAVNRYVVQKGSDRYIVLFWYQAHGRVVTSEYVAKVHLMLDAVRMNRTDGALVRLIVPVPYGATEAGADEAARGLVQEIFPQLPPFLPL